jgi:hypothetical protein
MKEKLEDMLSKIDLEIDEIDLYDYDIIETSLSMIHKLQVIFNDLRTKMQTYVFPTKGNEILFFKTHKPEHLPRFFFNLLFYTLERISFAQVMVVYSRNDYSSIKEKDRMQNFVFGKQMIVGKGIGESYHSPVKQAVKQCHE